MTIDKNYNYVRKGVEIIKIDERPGSNRTNDINKNRELTN